MKVEVNCIALPCIVPVEVYLLECRWYSGKRGKLLGMVTLHLSCNVPRVHQVTVASRHTAIIPGHSRISQVDRHRHATILHGKSVFFLVKICINPYPSFMHRCISKTFTRIIHIAMQFAKKLRHCVIKSTASSKEPKSELRLTPLIE